MFKHFITSLIQYLIQAMSNYIIHGNNEISHILSRIWTHKNIELYYVYKNVRKNILYSNFISKQICT